MNKPLPKKLRMKWDELIATEGAAMGLADCRVFLENKLVNDVFYEGVYKGEPCVVKCSSRAPDSLRNEYEMLQKLRQYDEKVSPKPFCLYEGDMSFLVTEKLGNGAVTDAAGDILRIARALDASGIVHRDVSVGNLMTDGDGHLRLIDFQFAVDRNDYRESEFMRRNPAYLYVTFGNTYELRIGEWNDLLGFGLIRCLDHYASGAAHVRKELEDMVQRMLFSTDVSAAVRFRLRLHEKSLAFRRLFSGKSSLEWRYRKLKALLSR